MTVFNLDEPAGAWFEMEDGGRVQLRLMTPEAMQGIRKAAVKKRIEYKRVDGKAERFEVEEVEDDLYGALFWDHVIVAWEHLADAKGTAIPCDRAHKRLLMARVPRFAAFVGESLETLRTAELAEAQVAVKNS